MEPYISGYASIPKSYLSVEQIARLKKRATVTPRAFNPGEEKEPINGWRETPLYLHLPIALGLDFARKAGFEHAFKDKTSLGHPITVARLPDPNHPEASDGQEAFMDAMLYAAESRYALIGKAGTGNGKSAVGSWLIGTLGRTALVVVPGETLAHNWKDELKKHLGLEDHEIGWIQQKKCDYIGKKVVIAVVHSLCRRAYPPAFYAYFGTVVYDEVHSMAARTFSKTLGKITARHKIALTATPTRKDGCQNLFLNYFGADLVTSDDDNPMECTAWVVDYNLPFEPGTFPESSSIALNILTKLKGRNELILKWINRLYVKKRVIVVMSDRIEQLCHLKDVMHKRFKVPAHEMTVYAKQEIIGGSRIKLGIKELQRRKKDPSIRIYYASYGIFKQGENIPRLDAGVEASPRGDGIQPPGRIRRRRKNKPRPFWLSIRDHGSGHLARKSKSRIKEFQQAKIKVVYANSSS